MKPATMYRICVIDGQGGGIGSTIIRKLKDRFGENIEVLALGTNAIATAQMLKSRANRGASGVNAIVQTVKTADLIIGTGGNNHAPCHDGRDSPRKWQRPSPFPLQRKYSFP